MKHCRKGRQFGRVRSQRKALFSSMLSSLFIYESIKTTEAKAKELRGKVDRIINKAKKSSSNEMEMFRKLESELPKVAINKIKEMLNDRLNDRNSGYTRLVKVSPRKSDGAKEAILEFVDYRQDKEVKKDSSKKEKK